MPSELIDDRLILKPKFGSGFIQNIKLQDGLSISFFNLQINKPTILNRIEIEDNSHCLMHFHYSKTEIKAFINNKPVIFHNLQHTVHFSSSTSPARYIVPSNLPINLIHIWMTREWLIQYLDTTDSNIYQDLIQNRPIALFDTLSYRLNSISNLTIDTTKRKILATIFEVLNFVIEKLESKNSKILNIPSKDRKAILEAKRIIENRMPDKLSIPALANHCKMSESKFKRLFKLELGTTPFQYHLRLKMNLAKQMLQEGKFKVKEVAMALNYSYMGNFSKQFSSIHGLLPSDIIKS